MEDIRNADTITSVCTKALKGNGTMFIHNFVFILPYGENIPLLTD